MENEQISVGLISKEYQKEQLDTSLGVILGSLKLALLNILKRAI